MKKLWIMLFFFAEIHSFASVYQIGNTRIYKTPNELYKANIVQQGDTIEIDAEEFRGQETLAVWYPNNLLIRGVGGKPHLIADGAYIMGKGIWVLGGDNIIVENIEFSGAMVPDKNGAGIRLDGTGMTIRHCSFHDCEDGILTSNPYEGDILIEYSEFANNGYGNGYSHNLYVGHVNSLTFRFNYTHHAKVGHAIKSRAQNNFIYYNRIMDEDTGYSSRLIDLPNGGLAIIMGNLIMQGINGINSNMVGYGPEGLENELPHELYVINNTFVNKRVQSCLFVSIKEGTTVANISNNIFTGGGTLYSGNVTTVLNNLEEPIIDNVQFQDEENYNYKIFNDSPAVDYGTTIESVYGYSLTPDSEYQHPVSFNLRNVVGKIDAGAYEFSEPTLSQSLEQNQLTIFPNPTKGKLSIKHENSQIRSITIFDISGNIVLHTESTHIINLSNQRSGVYIIKAKLKNGKISQHAIIKE